MMDQQKAQVLFMQWLMSKRICTLEDAEGFYRKLLFDNESNGIEAGSIGGMVFS